MGVRTLITIDPSDFSMNNKMAQTPPSARESRQAVAVFRKGGRVVTAFEVEGTWYLTYLTLFLKKTTSLFPEQFVTFLLSF